MPRNLVTRITAQLRTGYLATVASICIFLVDNLAYNRPDACLRSSIIRTRLREHQCPSVVRLHSPLAGLPLRHQTEGHSHLTTTVRTRLRKWQVLRQNANVTCRGM